MEFALIHLFPKLRETVNKRSEISQFKLIHNKTEGHLLVFARKRAK